LLAAGLISFLMKKAKNTKFITLLGVVLLGYIATYLFGNIYLYLIKNLYLAAPISFVKVCIVMVPYMIKDLVLLIIAAYSATLILPILRKSGYIK